MRRLFFTIVALIAVPNLIAQDIITKKDGSQIEANVIEIETSSIKYKKFSNPNGPTYNLLTSDILEIKYENGETESYSQAGESGDLEMLLADSKKKIFIKTTIDSDVHPTEEVWKEEMERAQLKKVKTVEEADLIFEFRIKRAMGEARVSVDVLNAKDNQVLWESDKYRGTANVYNKMGASLDAIRKCIRKGIIPAIGKGEF